MRTYKFRLYPSAGQEKLLIQQLNLCRELYNAFLQQRVYAHKMGKSINYNYQQDQVPELKKVFPEFKDIHSQVLQDAAHRVDKAFGNFFRRIREKKNGKNIKAGFPRFKPKDGYNSITYPQSGFRILDNGHVWLSRIGEIRMFMHRPISGDMRTLSIKRDHVGDWFITVTADSEKIKGKGLALSVPQPRNAVGVDLGLESFMAVSDGTCIESPRFLRGSEKQLKKAQKSLSRKKKGSGKRERAKKRVAKVHRKIQRQRDDFSYKISSSLVENHDLIVFEDLNIKGMVKSHHLAKSIADASWNRIIQYTGYKAESAGTTVMLIDPRNTSRKCSACGNIKEDLRLSDRIYHCDACGLTIDRDLNAAINIRNIGLIKVGRGTPEFTPVEIRALPARATRIAEAGSPLR